ncbi:hypothetical protein D3C78_1451940 [compost metagenome]
MSFIITSRSCTMTTQKISRQAASIRCSGRRVRHACIGNCRQLMMKMAAGVSTPIDCTVASALSGAKASMASSAALSIHSARSVRGSDCLPKRQVNRQKQATYSTNAMALARANDKVLGSGQGLVSSTLLMNSTQNSDIRAYQP